MSKLDVNLLKQVKRGFVAMPAGADPSAGPGPVAGGGMMTQAQAAPMGGDPAAMGGAPPMDPAMAGGDPAAMGGDPAAMGMDPAAMGMDPAAMGMDPAAMGAAPPEAAAGQITMSVPEFLEVIAAMGGSKGAKKPAAAAPDAGGATAPADAGSNPLEAKLDLIINTLGLTGGGGEQPPTPPA